MQLLQHHMLCVIGNILNNSYEWLLIGYHFVILSHFEFLYYVNSKTYEATIVKILENQFIGKFYELICSIEVMLIHLSMSSLVRCIVNSSYGLENYFLYEKLMPNL